MSKGLSAFSQRKRSSELKRKTLTLKLQLNLKLCQENKDKLIGHILKLLKILIGLKKIYTV